MKSGEGGGRRGGGDEGMRGALKGLDLSAIITDSPDSSKPSYIALEDQSEICEFMRYCVESIRTHSGYLATTRSNRVVPRPIASASWLMMVGAS